MESPRPKPRPTQIARPKPKPAGTVVNEVALTELRRETAAVIRRVVRGEVAVVSRHGRPVAMLVAIGDRRTLRPVAVDDRDLAPLAARFAARALARRWSELLHGRWYDGHGIHGEYPSKRRGRRRRFG